MDTEERKKWLKLSRIGICVPLKDKETNKKEIHMANTLERLWNKESSAQAARKVQLSLRERRTCLTCERAKFTN